MPAIPYLTEPRFNEYKSAYMRFLNYKVADSSKTPLEILNEDIKRGLLDVVDEGNYKMDLYNEFLLQEHQTIDDRNNFIITPACLANSFVNFLYGNIIVNMEQVTDYQSYCKLCGFKSS